MTTSPLFRSSVLAATGLLLVCALGQQARAATKVVGTCRGSSSYSTIQSAVNAAGSGDVVEVCPGKYAEQVVITKPLSLTGIATFAEAVTIVPPATMVSPPGTGTYPQVFVYNTGGVTVSNLIVDGAGNTITGCGSLTPLEGIYFKDASGAIRGNIARNQSYTSGTPGQFCGLGFGIRAYGDVSATDVDIELNSVQNYDGFGISAELAHTDATIENNAVAGPGDINNNSTGIYVFSGAAGTVGGNIVNNNSAQNGGGAATGIFVDGAPDAKVVGNVLNDNANSISFISFTRASVVYSADGGKATGNAIFRSLVYGVYVCSDHDLITGNQIVNSGTAGVLLASNAGFPCLGNDAVVRDNSIVKACAGVLVNPELTGEAIADNDIDDTRSPVEWDSFTCP